MGVYGEVPAMGSHQALQLLGPVFNRANAGAGYQRRIGNALGLFPQHPTGTAQL